MNGKGVVVGLFSSVFFLARGRAREEDAGAALRLLCHRDEFLAFDLMILFFYSPGLPDEIELPNRMRLRTIWGVSNTFPPVFFFSLSLSFSPSWLLLLRAFHIQMKFTESSDLLLGLWCGLVFFVDEPLRERDPLDDRIMMMMMKRDASSRTRRVETE